MQPMQGIATQQKTSNKINEGEENVNPTKKADKPRP